MRKPLGRVSKPAGTPPSAGTVGGQRLASLDETLARVTSAVRETVGWADYVSVCVVFGDDAPGGPGSVGTLGATSPVALKADALQWELGEGPSVDAAQEGLLVHASALGSDERWPTYARRASELGIASQTAAGLADKGRVVGALNLYSRTAHDLDERWTGLLGLLAVQTTTAITFSARIEALTEAMANRQVIGQAIGIAMERYGVDESRAFDRLVTQSQHEQRKLRLVAGSMVDEANDRAT